MEEDPGFNPFANAWSQDDAGAAGEAEDGLVNRPTRPSTSFFASRDPDREMPALDTHSALDHHRPLHSSLSLDVHPTEEAPDSGGATGLDDAWNYPIASEYKPMQDDPRGMGFEGAGMPETSFENDTTVDVTAQRDNESRIAAEQTSSESPADWGATILPPESLPTWSKSPNEESASNLHTPGLDDDAGWQPEPSDLWQQATPESVGNEAPHRSAETVAPPVPQTDRAIKPSNEDDAYGLSELQAQLGGLVKNLDEEYISRKPEVAKPAEDHPVKDDQPSPKSRSWRFWGNRTNAEIAGRMSSLEGGRPNDSGPSRVVTKDASKEDGSSVRSLTSVRAAEPKEGRPSMEAQAEAQTSGVGRFFRFKARNASSPGDPVKSNLSENGAGSPTESPTLPSSAHKHDNAVPTLPTTSTMRPTVNAAPLDSPTFDLSALENFDSRALSSRTDRAAGSQGRGPSSATAAKNMSQDEGRSRWALWGRASPLPPAEAKHSSLGHALRTTLDSDADTFSGLDEAFTKPSADPVAGSSSSTRRTTLESSKQTLFPDLLLDTLDPLASPQPNAGVAVANREPKSALSRQKAATKVVPPPLLPPPPRARPRPTSPASGATLLDELESVSDALPSANLAQPQPRITPHISNQPSHNTSVRKMASTLDPVPSPQVHGSGSPSTDPFEEFAEFASADPPVVKQPVSVSSRSSFFDSL